VPSIARTLAGSAGDGDRPGAGLALHASLVLPSAVRCIADLDECLNENWFSSLADARERIATILLADLRHHFYVGDRQGLRAGVRSQVFVGFHGDLDLLSIVAEHGVMLALQNEAFAVGSGQVESAVHAHEATRYLGGSTNRGRSAAGLLAEAKGTEQQNGENQKGSAHSSPIIAPF
jgi:hypothetical protein